MINLLPYDLKRQVKAARTNIRLINYITILSMGIVFLCGISFVVYSVLLGTKVNAENLAAENASKSSAYNAVRSQADALRASLASAKVTLDKEIVYTRVITGIAGVMPSGVVLENLSLSPSTFGTPITLQAYARSINDAIALKDSFQQSPLFSNVSFESLSTGAQTSAYPLTVSLNVTINKSAAL